MKDFKDLIERSTDTGVIGVSPNLPFEQIDKKLTAFLMKASKKELLGKFMSISTKPA